MPPEKHTGGIVESDVAPLDLLVVEGEIAGLCKVTCGESCESTCNFTTWLP